MLQVCFDAVLEAFARTSLWSVALRQLTVQQLSGDPGLIHANDMSCLAQLGFQDHCFNAGGLGSLEDFEVCDFVPPPNLHYGA